MTTDSKTMFLDRGDGRIAYDVVGSGPLVIAVPGMGDLRSTYRHLVPPLVEAGFRVATMDLRGHGDSDVTFDSYDDPAAASDILALAGHLGAEHLRTEHLGAEQPGAEQPGNDQPGAPAIVIGNSMGAAAAVVAAAQSPGRIRGLVLMGAFVRDQPVGAVQRLMMRAVMGGPWARLAWLAYFPRFFPTRRDVGYREHRDAIATALARPGYGRAFRATLRTSHAPAEAVLDLVHTDVLVVMGSKDPDFADPQGEAEWIAQRLGGRSVLIADAGHYPQSEFPDLTTPAVVAFARQLTAGSQGA